MDRSSFRRVCGLGLLAARGREDRTPLSSAVEAGVAQVRATSVAADFGDPSAAITDPAQVLPLLERAAHADLLCLPGERETVGWTQRAIRAALAREGVRVELERLAASYEPRAEPEARTLHRGARPRVHRYAGDPLADGSSASR
jgi:hypothetical protein